MSGVEIASTLDCTGLVCPLPVIKLSKAIKVAAPGAVIELLATDPGAVADLEAFERRTGHRVLERSEASGIFRFLVQRAS
ncbi:MAG: sulfurtransferase TusA family protein [Candidatus Rokubacteria bacterium]|nr:sulfurtransferase TusA family protein [Candidatus Rokubacteria bacterium]